MVNRGGRSRGCLTCRRRRVKCGKKLIVVQYQLAKVTDQTQDEVHPYCQRCLKAGILCTSYNEHDHFVDETKRFRVSKSPKSSRDVAKELSKASPRPSPSRRESKGMQLTHVPTHISMSLQPDEDFVIHKHLVTRLLIRASGPTAPDILSAMVNYEPHAPSATLQYSARLSAKPIHKDALRALAAVYFGKMHRDTRIFDMGVRAYVRSLQRMRTALASPVAVLELETLVSVLCLGLYENVASSDTAGWLNHYEGVSHLVSEEHDPAFDCVSVNKTD